MYFLGFVALHWLPRFLRYESGSAQPASPRKLPSLHAGCQASLARSLAWRRSLGPEPKAATQIFPVPISQTRPSPLSYDHGPGSGGGRRANPSEQSTGDAGEAATGDPRRRPRRPHALLTPARAWPRPHRRIDPLFTVKPPAPMYVSPPILLNFQFFRPATLWEKASKAKKTNERSMPNQSAAAKK